MEKTLTYVQGAVAIVLTFGLAVFVHEFGHMMFALLRGVGVESFAIGMGPKITSWRWRGIDFSLRWFPVGGFVKLQGRPPAENENKAEPPVAAATAEAEAPADQSKTLSEEAYDDMFALQGKGLITKVMVFGGGVFMNFVTATVTIAMILFVGQTIDQDLFVIEKVTPGSIAAQSGLAPGDKVIAYNGQPIKYYNDFFKDLGEQMEKAEKPLLERTGDRVKRLLGKEKAPEAPMKVQFALTVQRGPKEINIALPPLDDKQIESFVKDIPIRVSSLIGGILPNAPADNAGIKPGDRITAVNGKPVQTFQQMAEIIRVSTGKPVAVTYERKGQAKIVTLTPVPDIFDPTRGQIGVTPSSDIQEVVREANPLKALAQAPGVAYYQMMKLFQLNVKVFRKASFKQLRDNVGGPIAIAAITAKAAQGGFIKAAEWFVQLNLLLLIFNLLPLPVLDGGFILLSLIEAIIRRPVPPRVLQPVYTVFVIGFIVLIVLISVQDVVHWVPKLIR